MNTQWVTEELRLWNELMYPRRRRITSHSVPVNDTARQKQLRDLMDKQVKKEFTDGWKNYQTFVEH
jgi:hypothetical protein